MCAISLLWCKGEVERLAFSQVDYLLLEGWQCYTHAANEDEWALIACLFDEVRLTFCDVVQLV